MNLQTRRALLRQIFMAAWGMLTVVLIFIAILLCIELGRRSNQAPVRKEMATRPTPAPIVEPPETVPTRNVTLFFADVAGRGLAPETAAVEHDEYTVDNCRNALQALIKGPQDGKLAPILPPTTKIRGVYLIEEGHLVVDLAIEIELDLRKIKSAAVEASMIYGIANTLAQPELKGDKESAVQKISFLIEGSPPRESFPAHLELSRPTIPDSSWLAPVQEQ